VSPKSLPKVEAAVVSGASLLTAVVSGAGLLTAVVWLLPVAPLLTGEEEREMKGKTRTT